MKERSGRGKSFVPNWCALCCRLKMASLWLSYDCFKLSLTASSSVVFGVAVVAIACFAFAAATSDCQKKCQWCHWWWLEQFHQVLISGWTFRHGTVHSPSQQLPGCTSRTLHRFSTARLTTIGSPSSSTTSHEANIHPPSEQQYRLTGCKTPSYLLTEEHTAMISVLHVHCATD